MIAKMPRYHSNDIYREKAQIVSVKSKEMLFPMCVFLSLLGRVPNKIWYLTKFSYDDLGYDLKNVNIENSQHNLAKPHLMNCSRNILELNRGQTHEHTSVYSSYKTSLCRSNVYCFIKKGQLCHSSTSHSYDKNLFRILRSPINYSKVPLFRYRYP